MLVLTASALVAGAAALAWYYHIDWRHIDPKDRLDLAAMVGAPVLYFFCLLFIQRLFLANGIDVYRATASDADVDVAEPLWVWSLKYLANMSLLVAWLFGTALTEAYLVKIPYTLADVAKYLLVAAFGIAVAYGGALINRIFDRMPRKARKFRR
ncbi:MAG: hypothetical protein WDN06_06585 [Asticcacaulis sp.]